MVTHEEKGGLSEFIVGLSVEKNITPPPNELPAMTIGDEIEIGFTELSPESIDPRRVP